MAIPAKSPCALMASLDGVSGHDILHEMSLDLGDQKILTLIVPAAM
jgi:hypothetical protein